MSKTVVSRTKIRVEPVDRKQHFYTESVSKRDFKPLNLPKILTKNGSEIISEFIWYII